MELDDLKKNWKEHIPQKITNTDIMELIHHKSYGPIESLKKRYRKEMINLIAVPVLILLPHFLENKDAPKMLSSVMYWAFVALCIAWASYAFYNYRIVTRMEGRAAMVKENLEQQINLLERRMKNMTMASHWLLWMFIASVELIPYFPNMPKGLHAVHPIIRFGIYGLMFIYQHFIYKRLLETRYGQHIKYLKDLVKEMQ
jgi:hypothetical protein